MDIVNWTTIILRHLRIPIYHFARENIAYEVRAAVGAKTGKTWLAFDANKGDCVIHGTFDDKKERVHITQIELTGDCSGSVLESLQLMLAMSTGRLRALVQWEDGTINLLDSDNGLVKYEEIDIVEMFSEGGTYDQHRQ